MSEDFRVNARSIFSPATGFIERGGFDWTCNPYLGCSFGCVYCYAKFLPQNPRPREDWGRWFRAKVNAVELARKQAHKVAGQCLYLSSVTDPYLSAERGLGLTRGILEALVPHQPRLLVQTRGPLVIRDIDVLQQFRSVRVNVSIPTDHLEFWELFEPKSPPLERRWLALEELKASGVPIGVCVTPMLPLRDVGAFVDRIVALAPDVVVAQDFHGDEGCFGAHTGEQARALLRECGWTPDDYRRCLERLRQGLPQVYEAEAGFFPPPAVDGAGPLVAQASRALTTLP